MYKQDLADPSSSSLANKLSPQLQQVLDERINVSFSKIVEFCDRPKIVDFSLFGSVLRDDFRCDSDIDVLYKFAPQHGWSLFDVIDMRQELEEMLHKKVYFVDKKALRNPYRRQEILRTYQVIYSNK
ncbi:MAG: hypothetical protein F6K24_45160 [Okeania sp. SIO2D1]|nr:hypothetical protein [Okeania sp. SIO2D1]